MPDCHFDSALHCSSTGTKGVRPVPRSSSKALSSLQYVAMHVAAEYGSSVYPCMCSVCISDVGWMCAVYVRCMCDVCIDMCIDLCRHVARRQVVMNLSIHHSSGRDHLRREGALHIIRLLLTSERPSCAALGEPMRVFHQVTPPQPNSKCSTRPNSVAQ